MCLQNFEFQAPFFLGRLQVKENFQEPIRYYLNNFGDRREFFHDSRHDEL